MSEDDRIDAAMHSVDLKHDAEIDLRTQVETLTKELKDSRRYNQFSMTAAAGMRQSLTSLEKELAEAKKNAEQWRQWHDHASQSARYYRDEELPASQERVKMLEIDLRYVLGLHRHEGPSEMKTRLEKTLAALASTKPSADTWCQICWDRVEGHDDEGWGHKANDPALLTTKPSAEETATK